MNRNKKIPSISVYTFIQFIVFIISVLLIAIIIENNDIYTTDKYIKIVGWFSNVIFLWDIFAMYRIKHNILDFSIVFFLFFFLFCNGQIMLYTFGMEPAKMLLFQTATKLEILDAAIYFLLSMVLFCMGAMVPIIRNKEMSIVNEIDQPELISAIRDIGLLLFVVSVIPYFYIFFGKSFLSLVYGYSALYTNSMQISGVVGYLSKLFIPSILMLLYVNYHKKSINWLIHIFLFGIAFVGLLSGNRGDGFSIIITLLVFKQLYGKEFSGRKIIKLLIIAIIIMSVIPVFASYRRMENRKLFEFFSLYIDSLKNGENNLIVSSISELGGTGYAYILTRRAIPSMENFHYGLSYMASVLMIIPSQILGGFSFARYAALDIWLQNIHRMNYGPGFSITAETYYNFGWVGGIAFTFVIGYFFSSFFNLRSKDKNKNELLRLLSLVFLYNSIIVARFPFHNTVRNIVYIYLIPYSLIWNLYNVRRKRLIKK